MIEGSCDGDEDNDALALMNRSAQFIDMSCSDDDGGDDRGDDSMDYGCKVTGEENEI